MSVTRLRLEARAPTARSLVYSTYLGGTASDAINGIAVDGQGNVYVTGETESVDFPTTPGVLQEQRGKPALHRGVHRRLRGEDRRERVRARVLDVSVRRARRRGRRDRGRHAGNAYVVGTTNSAYFPILDAFQTSNRGLVDAFVAKLNPDGTRLVYSSYLGGSRAGSSPSTGEDEGSAIALDAAGNAYVAGYTQSYDFPTTPGAFQPTLGNGICDYFGTAVRRRVRREDHRRRPRGDAADSLTVTPAEVAPGGTPCATWAGNPSPTASDQLRLYALGSSGDAFGEGDLLVDDEGAGRRSVAPAARRAPGRLV